MVFSINIDWYEEQQKEGYFEKWINHGRNIAEEKCTHKKDKEQSETNMIYSGWCEECEFSEDSCQPMMNYGYPLAYLPEEDKILKIINQTNLTVMENTETEEYFLVLCGGGMDLSQDIALAYIIAEQFLPPELALSVSTQEGLNHSGKTWRKIMNKCKKSLIFEAINARERVKQINRVLKESRLKEKQNKGVVK